MGLDMGLCSRRAGGGIGKLDGGGRGSGLRKLYSIDGWVARWAMSGWIWEVVLPLPSAAFHGNLSRKVMGPSIVKMYTQCWRDCTMVCFHSL